uniref:Uncharacterized protein n=1 Tax=Romanomermis culicivorax TaxID=13658 RepID=A0A915J2W1_ROMCU
MQFMRSKSQIAPVEVATSVPKQAMNKSPHFNIISYFNEKGATVLDFKEYRFRIFDFSNDSCGSSSGSEIQKPYGSDSYTKYRYRHLSTPNNTKMTNIVKKQFVLIVENNLYKNQDNDGKDLNYFITNGDSADHTQEIWLHLDHKEIKIRDQST